MLLENLKAALNNIPQSSFAVQNPSLQTSGEDAGYTSDTVYPEINFVSDLKSGLMAITDYREQNLRVQLELYKRFLDRYRHFDNDTFQSTFTQLIKNKYAIKPDLVIHEDQANQNNQVLALECKIAPDLSYEDFCIDLFKLMMFKEILQFEHLVFVIANVAPETVQGYFEKYIEADFYLDSTNLHILVKPSANDLTICINHHDSNC